MDHSHNYTASQARDNLYTLIKQASTGLIKPEITLKGADPVIMMSKIEYESWMETLSLSEAEKKAAVEPINPEELEDLDDLD